MSGLAYGTRDPAGRFVHRNFEGSPPVNRATSPERSLRPRLLFAIASAAILIIVIPALALTLAGGVGGSIESVIR